jgi:hypothetical protein
VTGRPTISDTCRAAQAHLITTINFLAAKLSTRARRSSTSVIIAYFFSYSALTLSRIFLRGATLSLGQFQLIVCSERREITLGQIDGGFGLGLYGFRSVCLMVSFCFW